MIKIHDSAYIAEGAIIKGDVSIGENSSVWFNAVLRGDNAPITIGNRTNIQDCSVLHVDPKYPVTIGDDCTIGHNVILHGCTIGNNCTIGMGAILMDGVVIGDNCIIGAGSFISKGKEIPENTIAFGNPAQVRKGMTDETIAANKHSAAHYVEEAAAYKRGEY